MTYSSPARFTGPVYAQTAFGKCVVLKGLRFHRARSARHTPLWLKPAGSGWDRAMGVRAQQLTHTPFGMCDRNRAELEDIADRPTDGWDLYPTPIPRQLTLPRGPCEERTGKGYPSATVPLADHGRSIDPFTQIRENTHEKRLQEEEERSRVEGG